MRRVFPAARSDSMRKLENRKRRGNNPAASISSSDEPMPLVDVEFHQTLVAHLQQQRLAGFLIREIGAPHDLVGLERLLAKRIQDILAIFQHNLSCKQTGVHDEPPEPSSSFIWPPSRCPAASASRANFSMTRRFARRSRKQRRAPTRTDRPRVPESASAYDPRLAVCCGPLRPASGATHPSSSVVDARSMISIVS